MVIVFAGRFSRAERIRQRAKIHLDDAALTEKTQVRYYNALRKLLPTLESVKHESALDSTVCRWIRQMWHDGEPLLTIGDALSAMHFFQPWSKGKLLHSWKLFGVWRRVEVPCRAPPLTLRLVRSLAAFEIDQGNMEMATLLLLAFHCLLRTGEILALKPTDFLLNDDQGIVSLQQSKSGVRNRAKEAVSITDTLVLDCLRELLKFRRRFNLMQLPLWSSTGSHFRARFAWLCEYFHLQQFHFRPYSLRRGGATKVFQDTGSMETALLRGRWESRRVAKIYICDALSFLPAIKLSAESQSRLRQYYFFSPSTGWPVFGEDVFRNTRVRGMRCWNPLFSRTLNP